MRRPSRRFQQAFQRESTRRGLPRLSIYPRHCSIPTSSCTSIEDRTMKSSHYWGVSSRRDFFTRAGSGLAGIALADLLAEDGYAAAVDPLAPKPPQIAPRAKNVIWCFMEGGPSQVDLFDPKPMLEKFALQPVPPSFHPEKLLTAQGAKPSDGLFPTRRPFKQYGQSGIWVSDWLPNIAQH